MSEDHLPLCEKPASCSVCSIGPLPGESRPTWLARVGEMYRAAPAEWGIAARAPLVDATCAVCGRTFQTVRALTCSRRCKGKRERQRKKERRAREPAA